ncbi:MAG TPA: hypothetical protein VGE77_00285 [Nocardioides sp.]
MTTVLGLRLVDGAVAVTVDGRPLVDDVRAVERRVADRQDLSLAGAYADLGVDDLPDRDATAHFATDGEHRTMLGCECGFADCWPLLVRVSVGPEHVRWSDVRQGHRDRDYGGFGYTFATGPYLATVASLDRHPAAARRARFDARATPLVA